MKNLLILILNFWFMDNFNFKIKLMNNLLILILKLN